MLQTIQRRAVSRCGTTLALWLVSTAWSVLAADAPIEIEGDVVPPRIERKVPLIYPEAARLARIEGKVYVQFVIGKDGSVSDIEVLNATDKDFAQAAVEAVRQWRYRPATLHGEPVAVQHFTVKLEFKLRKDEGPLPASAGSTARSASSEGSEPAFSGWTVAEEVMKATSQAAEKLQQAGREKSPTAPSFTPRFLQDWGEFGTSAVNGVPILELCIWDHECEDGDILQVAINDQVVMRHELFHRPRCERFGFRPGRNQISILAVNGTGHKGNCNFADRNSGTISVRNVGSDGATRSGQEQVWDVQGGAGSTSGITVNIVP